jgi:transcriptional regulator with XRE-family HTH domain
MTWREPLADSRRQRGWVLLGAAIRRRRLSLQWTQRVLEAESGIDQTVISRVENGKQYGLRWSRFAELVDALGGLDARGFEARPPLPRPSFAIPEPRPRIDLADGDDEPIGDDESDDDHDEADEPL